MEKIVEFFINNSKLNYVLFIFLILGGVYSYKTLPKEIFPPIVKNEIIIEGGYGGASANILDKMAVQSIEDEVGGITGVSKVKSNINSNYFTIKVKLEDGRDKNSILQKVKDAVSRAKKDFPSDMNEPISNVRIGKFPLLLVNISSATKSHDYIIDAAKELKSKLSNIKNLTDIKIYGEGEKRVKIQIDLNILKAYGVSSSSVLRAISSTSSIFPIGKISQKGDKNYFISTYNGEKNIQDLLNLTIKADGKILRLRDFAKITKEYKNDETITAFNAQNAVSINISKSEDGNSMVLVKRIRGILKDFKKRYPELNYGAFSDTSVYIRNRLNTVVSNILLGLVLVGLTMYILINKRIAFVVIVGVPTSFIIALIVFKYFGYSINMMNLLGALIALGVLVDDAIIVAENIQRHIENGDEIKDAVLNGTKEVLKPVLASSLTTIFAFLPMLVMSDEMGAFIKAVPIAISILILSSVIESFLFLPLHSKHFLKAKEREVNWQPFMALYEKVIRVLIHFRKTTIVLFYILVPLAIYFGFATSKFQLFPRFDGDQINIDAKLPVDTTLDETKVIVDKIDKFLLKNKEKYFIQSITSMAGFRMDASGKDSGIADNFLHVFIDLKKPVPGNFINRYITPYLSFDYDDEGRERTKSSYELENIMREDLEDLKNSHAFEKFEVKGPRAGIVKNPIELYIKTNDNKKAHRVLAKVKKILEDTNQTFNVVDDANYGIDEIKLKINKYGQSLGLDEKMLSNALSGYFLEKSVTKGFDKKGMFEVVIQEKNKNSLKTLQDFSINLTNQKIALKDVVDFVVVKNYAKIFKEGGKRKWAVTSEIKQNANANEILKSVDGQLREIEKQEGILINYGGEKEKNKQLKNDISVAAMIAMFLIFMTLLVMFNSFKCTFMILSVIPFSILGVFLGHAVMGLDLSMPSIIGALGLAGVVINDGIIMLEFIRHSNNIEELLGRAKLRLRPIFLTSITTLVGLSTLIFFPSGQAMIMQPLAVSLGFGLFWGTFLNLVYLPTLFALVSHTKELKNKK